MKVLLKAEFQYFIDHQKELVKKYEGKVLVIKDNQVIGAYETELQALTETCKTHEMGTFLIQKCDRGEDAYTAHFYSPCFA